jgi:hypothetical protein
MTYKYDRDRDNPCHGRHILAQFDMGFEMFNCVCIR